MVRFSNRDKTVAGALGILAVGAVLFSLPASAGTGGDSFFVHSQSGVATAKTFDGYAPRMPKDGSTSQPGGNSGGSDPGSGNTANPTPSPTGAPTTQPTQAPAPDPVALAGYKCGPMSLSVTDAMLQHDRDNRALVTAGKPDQVRSGSEGWQSMVHSLTGQSSVIEGAPADSNAARLSLLRLSSTMSPSDSSALFSSTIASLNNTTSACDIFDARIPQLAGNDYRYQWSGTSTYSESRYINEGGSLKGVTVSKNNGSTTVDRVVPGSLQPIVSDTLPYSYQSSSTRDYASIAYATTTDGYNGGTYTLNPDGSGTIQYFYWDQKSYSATGTPTGLLTAKRLLGPTRITFDSSSITGLRYADSNGVERSLTSPYTVAHYNQVTGQNWDGKYTKFGGVSKTIPFIPKANR